MYKAIDMSGFEWTFESKAEMNDFISSFRGETFEVFDPSFEDSYLVVVGA